MVVHRGQELPFAVLTNSTYAQSAKTAMDAKVLSGNTSFSFQNNSLQRFTTACSMVNTFQKTNINKPAVDFAFDILENVSQNDFTKWSIVYDLKNKKIYFKTEKYPDIKSVSFASFDFACASGSRVIDMNQPMKGAIDKKFEAFNEKINRTVMYRAAEESKSQVQISEEVRESNIAYANAVACKKD
jgi:choloylglycine hydrolase